MSEDFYSVLGVSRDADKAEIKQAYRQKATEHHPDVSDDPDAEEQFKRIQKAKEVLTDDEKRQLYDRLGHEQFVQAEKHGGVEGGGGGGARGARGAAGGNPFGGMGGIGDIFEEFFGGGSGRRARKGNDVVAQVTVDLEDVHEGVEREVTVRRPAECSDCEGTGHPPGTDSKPCANCNGQGQVTAVQQTPLGRVQQTRTCRQCEGAGTVYAETCSTCDGDGRVDERASVTVQVPAGIEDGQTLRLEGEGAPGVNGGPAGDLLVEVAVEESEAFERDGADLHRTEAVTFPEAALGTTITVETLDGAVDLDVPAGTQSGRTFRLEGKGIPRLDRRRRRRTEYGDLYVHVQVYVPESLNDEQRAALEQFAAASDDVREPEVSKGFFQRLKESL